MSSRTKTNKMLLKINAKTILESCIDTFVNSVDKIIIVAGHKKDEIIPLTEKYNNIRIAVNQNYLNGMFSSVKEGLKHVTGDRFFITPGDYPKIKPSTIEFMKSFDDSIIVPSCRGRTGHPVLISSAYIPEIIYGNYQSLRNFLRKKEKNIIGVHDSGILTDIDTIEDYYLILNNAHAKGLLL